MALISYPQNLFKPPRLPRVPALKIKTQRTGYTASMKTLVQCIRAGTSGASEPLWNGSLAGQEFDDGSCRWHVVSAPETGSMVTWHDSRAYLLGDIILSSGNHDAAAPSSVLQVYKHLPAAKRLRIVGGYPSPAGVRQIEARNTLDCLARVWAHLLTLTQKTFWIEEGAGDTFVNWEGVEKVFYGWDRFMYFNSPQRTALGFSPEPWTFVDAQLGDLTWWGLTGFNPTSPMLHSPVWSVVSYVWVDPGTITVTWDPAIPDTGGPYYMTASLYAAPRARRAVENRELTGIRSYSIGPLAAGQTVGTWNFPFVIQNAFYDHSFPRLMTLGLRVTCSLGRRPSTIRCIPQMIPRAY